MSSNVCADVPEVVSQLSRPPVELNPSGFVSLSLLIED